jgi:hypothetical protein
VDVVVLVAEVVGVALVDVVVLGVVFAPITGSTQMETWKTAARRFHKTTV